MDSTGTCGEEVSVAGGSGAVAEGAALPLRRVGVEVRVGVATLLGHDRHPAEVTGWGTVTAEVARTLVTAQRGAEWRYALTDSPGRLLLAGITRCRPHHSAPAGGVSLGRGGIVELQLPVTVLTELAADLDACGEWAAVVESSLVRALRDDLHGRDSDSNSERVTSLPDSGPGVRQAVRHQLPARACASPRHPVAAPYLTWIKADNHGGADQHPPP